MSMKTAICREVDCDTVIPATYYYCTVHRKRPAASYKHSKGLAGAARMAGQDRYTSKEGYVYRYIANSDLFAPEHRYVMEQILERSLVRGESVHHKNGDKGDNRPENLELWVGPIRYGRRAADLVCPHCGEKYLN